MTGFAADRSAIGPRGSRVPAIPVLALLLSGAMAGVVTAQAPRGLELSGMGVVTLSDPVFAGGGLQGALRPGGRARLALAMLPGTIAGRFAFRGELTAQFLLNPDRPRGIGVYAGGGVAGLTGARERAFVILGLGLETNPGGRSGWMVEAGVGGGARLAVGWRRRWLDSSRR